jgi:hypothetical protein
MGAITREERRRLFLARQEVPRGAMAQASVAVAASQRNPLRRRLNAILKAATIVALLGTGWCAYRVLEFHIPASIAEALPRV